MANWRPADPYPHFSVTAQVEGDALPIKKVGVKTCGQSVSWLCYKILLFK